MGKRKRKPSPRVLVVEDDKSSREYLLYLLKQLNIDTVASSCGEEALQIMEAEDVDGMLLDIALGSDITGITLFDEFRRRDQYAYTPIIAVTAYLEELGTELKKKGFSDTMGKPYSMNDLKVILGKNGLLWNL